jgi:hypothetical protein
MIGEELVYHTQVMKMFGAHVKHVIGVQVSPNCCYGTAASSNNCAPSVVRKAAGVDRGCDHNNQYMLDRTWKELEFRLDVFLARCLSHQLSYNNLSLHPFLGRFLSLLPIGL